MIGELSAQAHVLAYQGATLLAQAEPESPKGPEFGKASPIGLPVILLLLVATVLLIWNMNKHIKNLPESFDTDAPEADQLADDGTDRAGVDRAGVDRAGDGPGDGGSGEPAEPDGTEPRD